MSLGLTPTITFSLPETPAPAFQAILVEKMLLNVWGDETSAKLLCPVNVTPPEERDATVLVATIEVANWIDGIRWFAQTYGTYPLPVEVRRLQLHVRHPDRLEYVAELRLEWPDPQFDAKYQQWARQIIAAQWKPEGATWECVTETSPEFVRGPNEAA